MKLPLMARPKRSDAALQTISQLAPCVFRSCGHFVALAAKRTAPPKAGHRHAVVLACAPYIDAAGAGSFAESRR